MTSSLACFGRQDDLQYQIATFLNKETYETSRDERTYGRTAVPAGIKWQWTAPSRRVDDIQVRWLNERTHQFESKKAESDTPAGEHRGEKISSFLSLDR